VSGPARAVQQEIEALFGAGELLQSGRVHVVYATRDAQGRLRPLRIGPATPRSETDYFVLSLCRARADALLTTAENVRSEPDLSHRLAGRWAVPLAAYRAQLGKAGPPRCAILTRSGELPREHPVWSDGTPKILLTGGERVEALSARWTECAQVVGLPSPSARSACAWLRASGAGLVSVEAGPATAGALYDDPPLVDELFITLLQGAAPDPSWLAPPLPEDARLFRGLTLAGSAQRSEGGHDFRFERWVRHA
jgi:riboflavin biosynthesis pyrimidine reductase